MLERIGPMTCEPCSGRREACREPMTGLCRLRCGFWTRREARNG